MLWIVVADRGSARVLTSDSLLEELLPVLEFSHPPGRKPASELQSDRPGRTRSGPTEARSALDSPSDARAIEARKFAGEICTALEAGQDRFERLILVAPPVFLGELREAMGPKLTARVEAAIAKDLCHVPNHALSEPLRRALDDARGWA